MNLARQLLIALKDAENERFHFIVGTFWFLAGVTVCIWLLTF